MTFDPYSVLGVDRAASADELAAARRRKAFEVHPDVGGTDEAMRELNAAFELAMAALSAELPPHTEVAPEEPPRPRHEAARTFRAPRSDTPSFTIDVLPAEAHEALLVVTSWMGEVLIDDPPYLLDVFLRDPAPCWCRLELVPDAGATTVSIVVAGVDGDPTPDPEDVRDVWVANLNRLGDLG